MSAQHAQAPTNDADSSALTAAEARVVGLREEAGQTDAAPEAKARLIDALVGLAGEHDAHGDDTATAETLAEAESLIPDPLPGPEAWHALAVRLYRMKAGFLQRRDLHAEAVRAFEAALRDIPFAPGEGGREVDSLRVQLLVRLARSRLVLGQAQEVLAEISPCEIVLDALKDKIPPRPLETIRAAVLENHAVALGQLGEIDAAEQKFAASLALIDKIDAPQLRDLRERVRLAWAEALRAAGRRDEADAMLARTEPPNNENSSDENAS